VLTLLLLRPERPRAAAITAAPAARKPGVYSALFAMPVFWIMLAASFLVNLPFTLATTQLKTVVLAQGLSDGTAAMMVTVFAVSSILGRVIAGIALDYLPAHIIAAITFALPTFGLLLLLSPLDTVGAVALAFALTGAAFGGEGDILPYLVTRRFGIAIYSTVLGIMTAAMGAALGFGNFLLSLTGNFDAYLLIAATSAFAGSMLFLVSGRAGLQRGVPGEQVASA
jgi:hypothetical protein